MKEIFIQDVKQVDDVMVATIAVKEEGSKEELFGKPLRARSFTELENTLTNLRNEVNKIPGEIAKVKLGKWTPPTPAPVVETPAPTAEELEAQAISAKEMELQTLVEQVKKEKELNEIALENASVKAKLDELNALKA